MAFKVYRGSAYQFCHNHIVYIPSKNSNRLIRPPEALPGLRCSPSHPLTYLLKCLIKFLGQVVDPIIKKKMGIYIYFPEEKLLYRGYGVSLTVLDLLFTRTGLHIMSHGQPRPQRTGGLTTSGVSPSRCCAVSPAGALWAAPGVWAGVGGHGAEAITRLWSQRLSPGRAGLRFALPSPRWAADAGTPMLYVLTTLSILIKLFHQFSSWQSPAESCQMCFENFILVIFGVLCKKLLKCFGLPNFCFLYFLSFL